ncbi:hypothetical protein BHU72_00985 [Desulfuribacillus stibiiarsenatis]|uniref:NfeD-like C-terminal domain-containing protein n=1 Tax=Desulfuribacillus stibiiarsenatis TaxID=1390249 RepID=A0A1E5L9Q6_9FIRM|nr:NfeD family protein [Desulfuribacillus stibiiarsenatis]OEH86870.1 hypothetical protein BHU72_00985 [Desulfuribacillus stibiiarsenatis]
MFSEWIWLGITILFIILEVAVTSFLFIWFAIGALAAFLFSFFIDNMWIQITIFVVVSTVAIFVTKPYVKKLKVGNVKTNVEGLTGQECLVIETIDNSLDLGRVKLRDVDWRAVSIRDEIIESGVRVVIEEVEGNVLKVRKK